MEVESGRSYYGVVDTQKWIYYHINVEQGQYLKVEMNQAHPAPNDIDVVRILFLYFLILIIIIIIIIIYYYVDLFYFNTFYIIYLFIYYYYYYYCLLFIYY